MRIIRKHHLYFFVFTIFLGCEIEITNNENLSSEKQIFQMRFLTSDNESLSSGFFTEINEVTGMITAELPTGANISSLIPKISISDKASIKPMSGNPIDFNKPRNFIVTAEDGSQKIYIVSLKKNSNKIITKFHFTILDNEELEFEVVGKINNINKTIIIDLPLNAQINKLIPTIEIDGKKVIPSNKSEINFSNLVSFLVTADDESTQEYIVSASYDRAALIKFGEANNLFSRGWSLSTNYDNWRGVAVGDYNRVIGLGAFDQCQCIRQLIPELGLLKQLKYISIQNFDIRYENKIKHFPTEIGNLTNLESIYIIGLELGNLPAEIGQLTKLRALTIAFSNIPSIPKEIGNLVNLDRLKLYNNKIESLPEEIGQLNKLTQMNFSSNKLINIPSSIENLINLEWLGLAENKINSIPRELGHLTKLKYLTLFSNSLITIPKELSTLQDLEVLDLIQNNIISIPQEVCDMKENYNTTIFIDESVFCN